MKPKLQSLLLLFMCLPAVARAQSNGCDKPDFTVVNLPPFAINGEWSEVRAELRLKDAAGFPDWSPEALLGSREGVFFGDVLGLEEPSRKFPLGVMHRTCVSREGERVVVTTWTIYVQALVTRVNVVIFENAGLDQALLLEAEADFLMARLRLVKPDGAVVEGKPVWPNFGADQVIRLGDHFEEVEKGSHLLILTPLQYPAKVRRVREGQGFRIGFLAGEPK